ncbi:MAG: ATP-binding protein [Acholeplasmataceae bacterium]|nr:ATP-binding protein [Acholeplasmataceae bacterium]
MKKYMPRLIDDVIINELKAFGAILITGPKWCGKTTTAKQIAKSVIYMHDPEKSDAYIETAKIKPSLLLEGEKPRLIDEWQLAPMLWDAIRFDVDIKGEEGLYILTGSSTIDETQIKHSGAGRISRILMRTMSLYESGDSNGQISLNDLFQKNDIDKAISSLKVDDIANLIIRGGWPNSIGKSIEISSRQVSGYIETIANSEIKTIDGVERNTEKTKAILRSLARNVATSVPNSTILKDLVAGDDLMHQNTLSDYLRVLEKLYVIENLPSWAPQLRSKTVIRKSPVRYFIDPSIPAAILDANPQDLFYDLKTFGFLFESLVIRDLRIYAQKLNGSVYHYRDKNDLEVDAIIHLKNGKWGAIEVKLGSNEIDKAVLNLLKLKEKINIDKMNSPSFLAVVTGTQFGYKRPDGVYVIPIGCLKP